MKVVIAVLAALCLLAGCASMTQDFDPPKVTLDSFKSLPGSEGVPRFEIKLRVANPNVQALDIAGISYTIELLGSELVAGVSNDIPRIEGYAEEVITLESSLNLFQLLKLLARFGMQPADELDYRIAAKIDFNGLVPTQRVEDKGVINLNQALQSAPK
jgi:LEA14-like dessication related protein